MSNTIALALIKQMLRAGLIDADDIDTIADDIESNDDPDPADAMAGHLVRCQLLRANETDPSEWEAQKRRARMRIISDGGNSEGG